MIKFDLELDLTAEELTKGLEANLKTAAASTVAKVEQDARNVASKKLKGGLKHWNKGLQIDKVGDGLWVLSISGKLAQMMEEGFGIGDIKRLILGGNRYAHNKSEGKNYVDVPISMDADDAVKSVGVSMEQFASADEVVKFIQMSDWAKGGVRKEKKIVQRVKDVIRSRDEQEGPAQFLTIKRVTPDSKGWPSKPFKGAKVLESLDSYIERAFEKSLKEHI